jgi:hypothetical protein
VPNGKLHIFGEEIGKNKQKKRNMKMNGININNNLIFTDIFGQN